MSWSVGQGLLSGVNPTEHYDAEAVYAVLKNAADPRRNECEEYMRTVLIRAVRLKVGGVAPHGVHTKSGDPVVKCRNCKRPSREHDAYGKCLFDTTRFR